MSARLGHLRHLALKGPHAIAQGEALGWAAKHKMSPERAKYGSVQWTNLAGRKPSQAMPPFQGGNRVGFGFPGRSPGLSHLAPLGPGDGRALPPNRHPARKRGTHTAAGECRGRTLVLSPHGYGSRAFARDDDRVGGTSPRTDANQRTYIVIPAKAGMTVRVWDDRRITGEKHE